MDKLGYLIPEWPSQTHAFFWREISEVRAQGQPIVIFSTRRPPEDACRHDFAEAGRGEAIYLHPPRLPHSLTKLLHPLRLLRALRYVFGLKESSLRQRLRVLALLPAAADLARHAEAQEVAHMHGHSCGDAAHILALASQLGELSYSLTLHGDLPVYGVDHASKMKNARFVATVTRPLRHQVADVVGLNIESIPVISMGVDVDRFVPAAGRGKTAAAPVHLVTVARLNYVKGHALALEAMANARAKGCQLKYTIAGEGPERAAIEEKIAELNLSDSVKLVGTIGETEVLRLLQEADAFLLPSFGLGEAAPVSVMEAMACGLPVVCSRIGGVADMITDGVDGILIDQRDVSALTNAIVTLATDPSARTRIATAARRRAVTAFDYRIMAAQLADAIAASKRSVA